MEEEAAALALLGGAVALLAFSYWKSREQMIPIRMA
jgi:hypothetical protein